MKVSSKVGSFTESVIREMTRLALEHDAINLAQGFPDFPCPPELKAAAKAAIDADVNQYAITWGAKRFRDAIAQKVARTYPGWTVDPETELTVTGWRVGWVIAPAAATNATRKIHDFLTVGAAAPLQEGGVAAMNLPARYYTQLAEGYRERRAVPGSSFCTNKELGRRKIRFAFPSARTRSSRFRRGRRRARARRRCARHR